MTMAQAEATKQENVEETGGNGSHGAGKTAVRAAAIAAVSGATALAAKKAFGDRGSGGEKPRIQRKRGDDDVLTSMVSSAWDSAKDSVVPMIEDAAGHAGEFLARSGPEIVRDTILPRFIDGFERGRGSGGE
jgi:hypothetical protein